MFLREGKKRDGEKRKRVIGSKEKKKEKKRQRDREKRVLNNQRKKTKIFDFVSDLGLWKKRNKSTLSEIIFHQGHFFLPEFHQQEFQQWV